MPLIIAKKDGTCRACGHMVRKGEYADFTSAEGLSHPEPACARAPAKYRPNKRAGRCECGAHVPAGEGRLVLLRDDTPVGGRKHWGVCSAPGAPGSRAAELCH